MTDKQIRAAAAAGVDNVLALREELGVGSGCGSCTATAAEVLDEAVSGPAAPRLFVPSPA